MFVQVLASEVGRRHIPGAENNIFRWKKSCELFVQGFSMSNSQRLILHNSTVTHKRTGNNSKPPSTPPVLNTLLLALDTLALSSWSLVVAWNSVAPVQSLQGDSWDSSLQVLKSDVVHSPHNLGDSELWSEHFVLCSSIEIRSWDSCQGFYILSQYLASQF